MRRPRIFVGSSSENLNLAYAVQESFGHDYEITVWTQSIFGVSQYNLEGLLVALEKADFGVFLFAPDDVSQIRGVQASTVRDNVVFELGLFIGKLGRERCFIIIPNGAADLRLPTDILGLNTANFDSNRQDKNVVAALGSACNKIRRAIAESKFDTAIEAEPLPISEPSRSSGALTSNKIDCLALIESWMGARPASDNTRAIRYSDVDRELGLEPGSAEKYIEEAAIRWRYEVARKGQEVILFKEKRGEKRIVYI